MAAETEEGEWSQDCFDFLLQRKTFAISFNTLLVSLHFPLLINSLFFVFFSFCFPSSARLSCLVFSFTRYKDKRMAQIFKKKQKNLSLLLMQAIWVILKGENKYMSIKNIYIFQNLNILKWI